MLMTEQEVAKNITDVEAFGDLPPTLLDRLSQILSKRRVINHQTLDLFLKPDLDRIAIYDCASVLYIVFMKFHC
jgi:DNA repair protein RAD7